jgi:hypothetical protein
MPERLPIETGKGKGNAAGLAQGHDPPPVGGEQLVEFDQVAGDVNERRGDPALGRRIKDGQQQDRLVGRAFSGGLGPDWAGGDENFEEYGTRKTAS